MSHSRHADEGWQLQLMEADRIEEKEDCFESVDKLISLGINAGDVKKLQDAGFYTCNGLMMHSKKSLTGIRGLSEAKVEKICEAAEKLLGQGFMTGSDLLIKRKSVVQITTGSQALDELHSGGIETLRITEAFGKFRTFRPNMYFKFHLLVVLIILGLAPGVGQQGAASSLWNCDFTRYAHEIAGFCTSNNPSPHCCRKVEAVFKSGAGTLNCAERVVSQPELEHMGLNLHLFTDLHSSCSSLYNRPTAEEREATMGAPEELSTQAQQEISVEESSIPEANTTQTQDAGYDGPSDIATPVNPPPPAVLLPKVVFSPTPPQSPTILAPPVPIQSFVQSNYLPAPTPSKWYNQFNELCHAAQKAVICVLAVIGLVRLLFMDLSSCWKSITGAANGPPPPAWIRVNPAPDHLGFLPGKHGRSLPNEHDSSSSGSSRELLRVRYPRRDS